MFPDLWHYALMFNDGGGDGGSGGSGGDGGKAGEGGDGKPGAGTPPLPGKSPAGGGENLGFPAETPVKEMTAEQQAAYWKHHSRKWQGRAEGRDDYDDVKAERDRLKAATLSDQEKAVEEAKKTAREEAVRDLGPGAVKTMLDLVLTSQGLEQEDIDSKLEFVDLTKFLTTKGEVDTDKVKNYVAGVAPGRSNQQWPDTGAGRRGDPGGKKGGGSVQSGRDAFTQRHSKKTN